MVLYLNLTLTKEKITDTYLIVFLKYVHTVHLILQVQQQHSLLRILFLLVSVLVVELRLTYLVKVIRSGHHLTLDLDLQEFLEVLRMNRLLQQLKLDLVIYSHSLVLLNLYLSVLFLVDYSKLVEMHMYYSVYNTLDLVDSNSVEMLQIQQQYRLLDLVHSRNSVVQQSLLLSTH